MLAANFCSTSAPARPSFRKASQSRGLIKTLAAQPDPYSSASTSPPPPFAPPPPPPPPPRNQGLGSRRNVLQALGAAAGGALIGYLVGVRTAAPDGVDAEDARDIMALRREARFLRDLDGVVWVMDNNGGWSEVKLDAQVPGSVLLRDPDGFVYYMGVEQEQQVAGSVLLRDPAGFVYYMGVEQEQQVDLTDDEVVAAVFGDGTWQRSRTRLQVGEGRGWQPCGYND
eukprot:gene18534-25037_t